MKNTESIKEAPSGFFEPNPKKISPKIHVYDIWRYEETKAGGYALPTGVYRDGILKLINHMGFWKKYKTDGSYNFIKEKQNIIEAVTIAHIRDAMTDYVNKTAKTTSFDYAGITFNPTAEKLKEIFFANSTSIFNDAILAHLPNHTRPVLRDDSKTAYFPFKNCVLKATKDGVKTINYKDLPAYCIWKEHIINRDCEYTEDGEKSQFRKFIKNVSGISEEIKEESIPDNGANRFKAFGTAMGYLLHNYSSPSTARAVIAYDQELSGKYDPNGGTGKGIIAQAVKQLRNTATIDGKKIKDDNQFSYQMVNERTQVIYFDDMRSNFDFLTFNSNLTEGWQIERKRRDAFRFAPGENPKTYISSNSILKNSEGTTAKRRQFIIEFAPYYSQIARLDREPILETHGNMFFMDDWSQEEWNRFYSYMVDCAAYYLAYGLQFYQLIAVNDNKLLQKTNTDFVEFINSKEIQPGENYSITDWAKEFKELYYGEDSEFNSRMFGHFINIYAKIKGWDAKRTRSREGVLVKFTEKTN